MKQQPWMMLICCLVPVLLFFVAPALGLNKENTFFILIPVMILFCFMTVGKGGCCGGRQDEGKKKDKQQSCH